jgi:hypothetical protein
LNTTLIPCQFTASIQFPKLPTRFLHSLNSYENSAKFLLQTRDLEFSYRPQFSSKNHETNAKMTRVLLALHGRKNHSKRSYNEKVLTVLLRLTSSTRISQRSGKLRPQFLLSQALFSRSERCKFNLTCCEHVLKTSRKSDG